MTSRAFARAYAEQALREAGISYPPVDLDDVARPLALRIERNAVLGPGIRGAYRPDLGLVKVISLPPQVERFPIAHEVGHAILNDGGKTCTEAMIREREDAAPLDEVLLEFNPESAASAIASELLIPSAWLRPRVLDGLTISDLRDVFDVTRPVLFIALQRDRLIYKVRPG